MNKKEAEKKATKLKQDDVDRRLFELKAELDSANIGASELALTGNSKPAKAPVKGPGPVGRSVGASVGTSISSGFNAWAFWLIAILSLVLSQTPGISWLFTPINQFTTMVHELSHALVCILTGGHVTGLTIVGDNAGHGGLTYTLGGLQFFIAQAGYLGTAVFGCLLIYLGQFTRFSKLILGALGVAMGICTLSFVGMNVFTTGFAGFFSFLWGAAISVTLLWLAKKLDAKGANLAVLFLAIQTALNSLSGVFLLVQVYCGMVQVNAFSDASIMQNMTHIPSVVWSLMWFLMSCAMLAFTLWHTYGKRLFAKKVTALTTDN